MSDDPGLPADAFAQAPQVGPSEQSLTPLAMDELVGLRFSLMQLRMLGYGILGVWIQEILQIITAPAIMSVSNRTYYLAKIVDLGPLLCVAIALVGFQGAMRRMAWEKVLLPILIWGLVALSFLHFMFVPIVVANIATLSFKQRQIARDARSRIEIVDRRAKAILARSNNLESLLSDLRAIPGLQVSAPPDGSLSEARREIASSLATQSQQGIANINQSLSQSTESFLRGALATSGKCLLYGFLFWFLFRRVMREFGLAIPYLDWLFSSAGFPSIATSSLREANELQRLCLAPIPLHWLFHRRPGRIRRPMAPSDPLTDPAPQLYQAPAQGTPSSGHSVGDSPSIPLAQSPLPMDPPPAPAGPPPVDIQPAAVSTDISDVWLDQAVSEDDPDPINAWMRRGYEAEQRRATLRRQRNLERYHAEQNRIRSKGFDPLGLAGVSPPPELADRPGNPVDPGLSAPLTDLLAGEGDQTGGTAPWMPEQPLSPRERRLVQRDHERARRALAQMAHSFSLVGIRSEDHPEDREWFEELQRDEKELQQLMLEARELNTQPQPRGLRGLWRWFLTHL